MWIAANRLYILICWSDIVEPFLLFFSCYFIFFLLLLLPLTAPILIRKWEVHVWVCVQKSNIRKKKRNVFNNNNNNNNKSGEEKSTSDAHNAKSKWKYTPPLSPVETYLFNTFFWLNCIRLIYPFVLSVQNAFDRDWSTGFKILTEYVHVRVWNSLTAFFSCCALFFSKDVHSFWSGI